MSPTDDDDDDDVPTTGRSPSLLSTPPPSPPPRHDSTRTFPPLTGRQQVAEPTQQDVDREQLSKSKLADLLARYNQVDEAKISIYRVQPEEYQGQSIKGFTKRWSCAAFRTVEDLLETVEREYGGVVWDFRLTAPNKSGIETYCGASRASISSPPKPKKAENSSIVTPTGETKIIQQQSPDAELVKEVISVFRDKSDRAEREKGNGTADGFKVMGMMKEMQDKQSDLFRDQLSKADEVHREQMSKADERIERLRAEMEKKVEQMASPGTEILKFATQQGNDSMMRVQKDAQEALDRQAERYQFQINDLTAKLHATIERTSQERQAVVDRAADERKSILERADSEKERMTERFTTEQRATVQQHQATIDALRRDRENDIQRLTADRDAERRQNDLMKQQFEMNLQTQLAAQRMLFEATIKGHENRVRELEEKVKSLAEDKEELLEQRMREATTKPNSLETLANTMREVKAVVGDLGFSRDKPSEPEPEIAATIRAAKETGIVDGVGRILQRFAERPAAPPVVYSVPINPATGMPYFPPAMQGMPQPIPQGPQPISRAPRPQNSRFSEKPPEFTPYRNPNAQPEPEATPPGPSPRRHDGGGQNPAGEQPINTQQPPQNQPTQEAPAAPQDPAQEQLRMLAKTFEHAMTEDVPTPEFSKQMVSAFGAEAVKKVIAEGVSSFRDMVQSVDADSTLLSVRGDTWLRELFGEAQKLIS